MNLGDLITSECKKKLSLFTWRNANLNTKRNLISKITNIYNLTRKIFENRGTNLDIQWYGTTHINTEIITETKKAKQTIKSIGN